MAYPISNTTLHRISVDSKFILFKIQKFKFNIAETFQVQEFACFQIYCCKFLLLLLLRYFADPAADRILQEAFGANVPSVTELSKKTSMIFVNQHYSLSGAKPLSPAIVELGGIHIKEAKPLDEVS